MKNCSFSTQFVFPLSQCWGKSRRWLSGSLSLTMLVGSMLYLEPVRPAFADSNSCATPGKDGPANSEEIVNTYFPPQSNSTLASGATSVVLDSYYTDGRDTPISEGDMLMIIQMQDATIDSTNTAAYGSGNIVNDGRGQSSLGNSGTYEFVRATNSVPLTGGTLTFEGGGPSNGVINAYSNTAPTALQGRRTFQVIRVVQYASLTLSQNVTVPDWDGSVGGVLSLDIAGDMNFNGFTINADNRGFRGGFVPNDPSNTSGANNDDYVLPGNTTEGSGKGEGIAGTPRYLWDGTNAIDLGSDQLPGGDAGRGAPGNAGGGGNAHNAGGGGGGNGGDGGFGGIGWEGAGGTLSESRGLGGAVPVPAPVGDRLIMGGGGGGGDVNNDDNGIRGGQGGGVVFIQADRFVGNGTITSNGSDGEIGEVVGAPDGAGGGGAGGTVALIAQSGNLSGLTVVARGGAGGNTTGDLNNEHGPGGGGGGGVVVSTSPGGQVLLPDLAGGQSGLANSGAGIAHGAEDGADGITGTINPLLVPPIQPGASCFPTLSVTKTEANPGSAGSRTAPGTATYSMTVTNTGPGGASGVQLTDELPSGFTYSSGATATLSGGATGPTSPSNSGSASVPVFGDYTIPKDGSVTVDFTVDIVSGTAIGTYQNPAYATYFDPTRTDAEPTRRITAATTPLTGANTTYESGSNAGSNVPGNNYDSSSSTGEDVVIINAFSPYLKLAKRITALNRGLANEQLFDTSFVDAGATDDDDNSVNWPGSAVAATIGGGTVESYISGIVDGSSSGISVSPGDEIEYTIPFLSDGDVAAQDVLICDRIPANTTFVSDAFNSSPHAGVGTGPRGILLNFNSVEVALTNADDDDEITDTGANDGVGGYYFPAGVAPSTAFPGITVNCGGTNDNGAIVVDVSDVPFATGEGTPANSYGFIRFRAVVD